MNIEDRAGLIALIRLCSSFSRALGDVTALQSRYKTFSLSPLEENTLYRSMEHAHRQLENLAFEVFDQPDLVQSRRRERPLR